MHEYVCCMHWNSGWRKEKNQGVGGVKAYCRAPIFKCYKFRVCEVRRKHFHESTLVSSLQFVIRVTIEFPLIFSKKNFVEVPKIHEICSPWKKVPYGTFNLYMERVQLLYRGEYSSRPSALLNNHKIITETLYPKPTIKTFIHNYKYWVSQVNMQTIARAYGGGVSGNHFDSKTISKITCLNK